MYIKKLLSVFAFVVTALVVVPVNAIAAQTYVSDQGHTEVLFGWSHAGVSMQHAEFTTAEATLKLADDIEKSSVSAVIDVNSLASGFKKLDDHLKSKDFLEAETYPQITFKSTSIKKTGDKSFDVTGDLTIHGVTNSVTLKADMTHRGNHPLGGMMDYYKGDWVAFKATTKIDHQAFKVGGFSTGPITIEINTEMKAK